MNLCDEPLTHQWSSFGYIVRNPCRQKRRDVTEKRSIPKLAVHVLFEFRARDGKTIVFQVAAKAINDLFIVNLKGGKGKPKVVEVAPFLPLIKGAQLGSTQCRREMPLFEQRTDCGKAPQAPVIRRGPVRPGRPSATGHVNARS